MYWLKLLTQDDSTEFEELDSTEWEVEPLFPLDFPVGPLDTLNQLYTDFILDFLYYWS